MPGNVTINLPRSPSSLAGVSLFFLRCGGYRVEQARPNNCFKSFAALTWTG